jgi:N utilization substance protein A
MHLDRHTGALQVFARKKVVEAVGDAKLEIRLAEARALNAAAELDDEIEVELAPRSSAASPPRPRSR